MNDHIDSPETIKPSGRDFGRANHPASAGTLVGAVVLVDFLVISLALCVTWWLRFETPLSQLGVSATPAISIQDYSGHIVFGATVMVLTLLNFRAYDYGRLLSAAHELRIVCRAATVWLVVYLGFWLVLKIQPPISRIYCLLGAVSIVVMLTCWRLILTHAILPAIGASFRRQTLIVGWNGEVEQIAAAIAASNSPEFEIAGLLLPGQEAGPPIDVPRGLDVLGDYDYLEEVLGQGLFDSVLVADFDLDRNQLAEMARVCEKEIVEFEFIPVSFPSLISGLSLRRSYGVPLLGVTRLPLHSTLNRYIKRLIDIAGALVGLLFSIPIIAIFGILIRRECSGAIFYKQRRIGLNGRQFDIIKLRSMRPDAESDEQAGWTVADDPRCLKVGKILRAWNIDEIPQFWNVLKGEMSLVGPRPERPELISKFKEEIPHYNARHSVKPGITGWAQVNGLRGDTDLNERIRYDLHYIESWNVLFDLLILLKTFLTRKGAC